MSEKAVAQLLYDAGFKFEEIDTMICIGKFESGLRPEAVGRATTLGKAKGSFDIGLFQINAFWWARPVVDGGCGVTELELFDPEINAKCARRVFNRHGYDGWIAYKKNEATCGNFADSRQNPVARL